METAAIATWRRGRRILFIMGVILLQGATLPNHGEQGAELYRAAQILHPESGVPRGASTAYIHERIALN